MCGMDDSTRGATPTNIPAEAYAIAPHFDLVALKRCGGKALLTNPLWDGSRWRQWIESPVGLIEVNPIDAERCMYWAREPARINDLLLNALDFMWRCWAEPWSPPHLFALEESIHSLGGSCAKIETFWRLREQIGNRVVADFVQSELEQLLVRVRSFFDTLQ
jgi:hypothetical protein